ncbi:hypothetical protein AWB67_07606 [Caballeronia terrestris]|uniref:Uncharacterized protein n=1 Tax=Caballeronia terrestris TaxID=1226301 RepID=A0A158L683_9BURK|nr:hypothetical protein AWB67_07606 [Caballeronia terrestris]
MRLRLVDGRRGPGGHRRNERLRLRKSDAKRAARPRRARAAAAALRSARLRDAGTRARLLASRRCRSLCESTRAGVRGRQRPRERPHDCALHLAGRTDPVDRASGARAERRIPRRIGGVRTERGHVFVDARRHRSARRIRLRVHGAAPRHGVSRRTDHAARARRRAADGRGRRSVRRGDPYRQIRSHQGAVPLGATRGIRLARDAATMLGARRAAMGRQGLGRVLPAAHRPGSAGRFHRRRSGPAARDGKRP